MTFRATAGASIAVAEPRRTGPTSRGLRAGIRIAAVAAGLLMAGCTSPRVARVEWPTSGGSLAFLHDGATTREDVLLTLGVPSGQFEGERILTYVVWLDAKTNAVRVLPREYALDGADPRVYALNPSLASLVLVFDARNVLQRHSLVAGQSPE